MKSYYKPRYKICFQTKNKVYLNKNSKFRLFYRVRDPIFIRRYFDYRYELALKNMKWNVARRFMAPFLNRQQRSPKIKYGLILRNKQQLKHFYGKLKEKQFQRLLKLSLLGKQQYKQEIFLGALEHRLDILLYRMRILPTIFACKQYILHQGIFVNNEKINLPHYKTKIGDIVSLNSSHWNIFYQRLKNKAFIRLLGYKRNLFLQDFDRYLRGRVIKRKSKKYKRKMVAVSKNISLLKRKLKACKLKIMYFIIGNKIFNKKQKLQLLHLYKAFKIKLEFLRKIRPHLSIWRYKGYLTGELYFLSNLILLKFYFSIFNSLITYIKNIEQIAINDKEHDKYTFTSVQLFNKSISKLNHYTYLTFRGNYYNNFLLEKKMIPQIRHKKYNFANYRYKKLSNWWVGKDFQNERNKRHKWWWEAKPHWYIPNYLEIDYQTLRVGILNNPTHKSVYYPFTCSFKKIINFYMDKGF